MKMDCNMRLTVPWIKKFERTDPAFFEEKKQGSVFFTFFIQAMVWSQIVIKIFEILNHIGF